jgi:hypothetical protein
MAESPCYVYPIMYRTWALMSKGNRLCNACSSCSSAAESEADWGLGPEMLSSSSGASVPCFFTTWLLCSRILSGFSLVRVDVVGQLQ